MVFTEIYFYIYYKIINNNKELIQIKIIKEIRL